jgi:hypothetical protein
MRNHHELTLRAAIAILPLLCATPSSAQNNTISGEFTVEPATLVSLGFEWRITGDDNRNAHVNVTFRRTGESQWHDALPLMREQHELIGDPPPTLAVGPGGTGGGPRFPLFKYTAPNMFAGSILNLEPDTEYECRFVLADTDGIAGSTEKTVKVRTRKEPAAVPGGHTYHVYPVGYEGPRQEPSFTGLLAAGNHRQRLEDVARESCQRVSRHSRPRHDPGEAAVNAGIVRRDIPVPILRLALFNYLNWTPAVVSALGPTPIGRAGCHLRPGFFSRDCCFASSKTLRASTGESAARPGRPGTQGNARQIRSYRGGTIFETRLCFHKHTIDFEVDWYGEGHALLPRQA